MEEMRLAIIPGRLYSSPLSVPFKPTCPLFPPITMHLYPWISRLFPSSCLVFHLLKGPTSDVNVYVYSHISDTFHQQLSF